jgi:hypothetical protein
LTLVLASTFTTRLTETDGESSREFVDKTKNATQDNADGHGEYLDVLHGTDLMQASMEGRPVTEANTVMMRVY